MQNKFILSALLFLIGGCASVGTQPPASQTVPVEVSAPLPTPTAIVIQSNEVAPPAMFSSGDQALASIDARNEAESRSPQGQKLREEAEAAESARQIRASRERNAEWGSNSSSSSRSWKTGSSSWADRAPAPSSSGSCSDGASAICRDGSASYSANRRGTCSHHGGVAQWCD